MKSAFWMFTGLAGLNLAVGNVWLGAFCVLMQASFGIAAMLELAAELARDEK